MVTVRHHLAFVEKLVTDAGGQLIKSLGDGTMSTFSSARVALEVAQKIQRENAKSTREPPLQLRVGIHSGDLIQTKDDFFGSVVNKAARVASVASPGEIRVSEATSLMAGSDPDFSYVDPVETELRGFQGSHMLFRLDW